MAYDVFLVSANEDRDAAKLIARRLRALKFKVWFDQKQVDETFDAKDARNAMNSTSMLVLWSENAVKSDWVRAAASVGHSRSGTLVQMALDKTIPYEPFRTNKRFSIAGMTSRKTPEGFYQAVDDLGSRHGRTDLRDWMGYGSKDEDERADWLAAHPDDPLALHAKAQREKELGKKPAPAPEAQGAAALAAASLKGATNGNGHRPVAGVKIAEAARPTAATIRQADADMGIGWGTIGGIMVAIAAMLVLAWVFRSQPITPEMRASMPAISNGGTVVAACPAGQVPRSLVNQVLQPGAIVDDTAE
ncbi:MAG: toll/interleukin-1 receptor domain-containing protein [Hyphomonas sp.]|uniref:toll/interleukin-1 receptor domain-containing protein n=1 Tax=Hyphomonas sp. TaxID=87 RepID=UPI003001F3F7